MDKLLLVANLKSNQNLNEAKSWLDEFLKFKDILQNLNNKEIIICPSFPYLFDYNSAFLGTNIKLGAQDISSFDSGAYTGQVNAKQLKDFAQYVLVGHSERRSNFQEGEDMLGKKVDLALRYGLYPIFLVQGKQNLVPEGVKVIAYEPSFAIGSGNPDTPESANGVAGFLKQKENYQVLYGGSVSPDNVKSFTQCPNLSGVLVGGGSLDPKEFIKIIQNA